MHKEVKGIVRENVMTVWNEKMNGAFMVVGVWK